jgi:hypothetical protein
MKLFRTYTFKWWQVSLFKIYLLALGLCIGSYWADLFSSISAVLILIIVVLSAYFIQAVLRGKI